MQKNAEDIIRAILILFLLMNQSWFPFMQPLFPEHQLYTKRHLSYLQPSNELCP